MRLVQRDGSPLPMSRVLTLSGSWGLGAAIGVALGAVLTAVSGAGAPGTSAVEPLTDLVVVPLVAGIGVFGVHFAVTLLIARLRAGRTREGVPQAEKGREADREDRVER